MPIGFPLPRGRLVHFIIVVVVLFVIFIEPSMALEASGEMPLPPSLWGQVQMGKQQLFLSPTTHISPFRPPRSVGELNPVMKSLLISGWGQLSQDEVLKGSTFITISVAGLLGAVYFNYRANQMYDHYRSTTDPDTIVKYRRRTESYDERRNQCLIVVSVNHLVNMIDIVMN